MDDSNLLIPLLVNSDAMAKKYSLEDALKRIMDGNSSDMEQLGEDDDDEEEEDEEWTPTARIGENPDSSDEEEENPDSSDDDEGTEEDTTPKQSARDKGKRKEYLWKRKQFEPPSVEFVECVEEDSEVRLDWTPYKYFKDFMTEEMLQEIAEQTNLYSVQKNGKSVNTNAQENQICGATCQENLTSGGSRCGDMPGKVAISMTLMEKIPTKRSLMLVLQEML
ncbi:hypothetical protein MHYP_G00175930 [Metynnis hypsauchen]